MLILSGLPIVDFTFITKEDLILTVTKIKEENGYKLKMKRVVLIRNEKLVLFY